MSCDISLRLGEFPEEDPLTPHNYQTIRKFMLEHMGHSIRLILADRSPTVKPIGEPKIDTSTPEKRFRWLTATKMLLEAEGFLDPENFEALKKKK